MSRARRTFERREFERRESERRDLIKQADAADGSRGNGEWAEALPGNGAGSEDSSSSRRWLVLTSGNRANGVDPETPPEGLALIGDMGVFAWRAIKELRRVAPYSREVFRQATIIASGSTMIILFVTFLLGSAVGQESAAVARALGADPAAANFSCVASTEAINTFIFGYVLAAKVGCGMVAELGSMRVREEVDALDSMGIRATTYLIATRLLAALLVLPFIYLLSVGASELGAYLNAAIRYGDVSPGTFSFFCFNAIGPRELLTSFLHGMVVVVGVITIALYFGWKVRGGPVEVGVATARSMAVNVIFCTATFLIYDLTFQVRSFVPIA